MRITAPNDHIVAATGLLQNPLEVLSPEQRQAVETHCTDMGPAYLSACKTLLPNSQSVIDRFHVAKKLGEVTDTLRKKTTEPTNEA